MFRRLLVPLLLALAFAAGAVVSHLPTSALQAQAGSRYFPETHHYLKGLFLQYWTDHGGLAQQGYPLTEEFTETSTQDPGQSYTVQYFERAVFERHPENAGTPYEVLLTRLGKFALDSRYPNGSNPAAAPVAAPTTVPFTSGGLGLSRVAWEKLHGPGVQPTPNPFPGLVQYAGGTYGVGYASNGLIARITAGFQQPLSIGQARAASREFWPGDTQLVRQDELVKYEGGSRIYDTYLSQSLSTVFPPGTENIYGPPHFWGDAPVGTFTVQYDMVPAAGNTTTQIELYTGRHD